MTKANFQTSSLSPGIGCMYFIEPAQPKPAFIVHDPGDTGGQWWRSAF